MSSRDADWLRETIADEIMNCLKRDEWRKVSTKQVLSENKKISMTTVYKIKEEQDGSMVQGQHDKGFLMIWH